MNRNSNNRIDVAKILGAAFAVVIRQLKPLLKTTLGPILIIVIVRTLINAQVFGQVAVLPTVLHLAEIPLSVLYLVPCHRIIYLGEGSVSATAFQPWTKREWRFLFLTVGAYMFVIAGTVFSVALTWLTMVILGIDTNTWGIWAQVPVLIIPTYVLARLSIILPATAVEKKTSLLAAWRLSRKNGWRLVFTIIYFPAVIFYLPNWVLSKINFLAAIPFDILGYLLSLIGVAALTLSYSELSNRGKLTGSNTRRKKGRRK